MPWESIPSWSREPDVPEIRCGYVDAPVGQLHYAECGVGDPILLLHQTPQSWDEFRELLPLLGLHRRAVAMDMAGFGSSVRLPKPQHIQDYAEAAWSLVDLLGLHEPAIFGHHTGGLVALEMAASRPGEYPLILSSCPWTDEQYRQSRLSSGVIDEADHTADGAHLQELWDMRRPYYPSGPTQFLNRFLADALRHDIDPAEGHYACARYRIEDRIGLVRNPVMLLSGGADPFSLPAVQSLSEHLVNARSVDEYIVEDGTVVMLQHCSGEVAQVVEDFFKRVALAA